MSQPTTITCAGLSTQEFQHLETNGGRTTMFETGVHTDSSRSLLQLYRTAPKRNGSSLGVRKSAIKLTKDLAVDDASGEGTNIIPFIIEVSMAVPVGCTEVQRAAMTNAVVDLLTGGTSANLELASLMIVGEI